MAGSFQDSLSIIVDLQDRASAQLRALSQTLAGVQQSGNAGAGSLNNLGGAAAGAAGNMDRLQRSHAGVNRELLVLAHELSQGNFKQFGGSLLVLAEQGGGLAGTLKLLAGLFTPLSVGIGATVGVVVGLGAAFYSAAEQMKAFNAAIALTNNYVGLTSDSYKQLVASVAAQPGITFGAANESLMALISSGKFAKDQIGDLSTVIIKQSQLSGQSIEDVAKAFIKLGDSPGKFVDAYNSSAHIFTGAQLEMIHKLEDTGKAQEAVTAALKVFTDYQNGPAGKAIKEQQGLLSKLSEGFSELWHSIKVGIGAEKLPLVDQLKEVNKEITRLATTGQKGGTPVYDALGNATGATDNAYENAIAKRKEILKQLAADSKKQIEDTEKAFDSANSQEAFNYFKGLGIRGAQSLKVALAAFDENVRKMRTSNPNSEFNDPAYLKQARDKVIKDNTNPIDDSASKQSYQTRLQTIDGYIKQEKDAFALRNEYLKVQLDKGEIDQEQYDSKIHDSRVKDLEDLIRITNLKVAAAQAEAKRTRGAEALRDIQKYKDEVKSLQDQELLANAQYEAALAKHAAAISDINAKMAVDIKKTNATRATAVEREFNKTTLSSNEAAVLDAQTAVIDRFDNYRERVKQQLQSQHASIDEINSAMKDLDTAQAEQLTRETGYAERRIALQQDVTVGFIKSYKDFQQQAQDSAAHASDFFKSITSGFEDFIYQFATTGKLSFKSLEQSITQSLSKIIAQILVAKAQKALLESSSDSFLGSAAGFFGSLFGAGHAAGGPVSPGTIYPVGEKGPELFAPTSAGTIIPNSSLGGTTNHFAVTILTNDQQSFKSSAQSISRDLAAMVNNANRKYGMKS